MARKPPKNVIDVNEAFSPITKSSVLGSGSTSFGIARTKKGKTKNFKVDIQSDRLLVNTDAREANKVFGAQLQAILAKQIESVQENVAASTLKRRQRDYDQFLHGRSTQRWRRRFAGGRIGEVPPQNPSGENRWHKKFNQSGRMRMTTIRPRTSSAGLAVATINFPANRFDPRTTDRVDGIINDAKRLIGLLGGKVQSAQQAVEFKKLVAIHAEAVVATSLSELRRKRQELRRIKVQVLKTIARAAVGG